MITVNVGSKVLAINFRHYTPTRPDETGQVGTACTIYNDANMDKLTAAVSLCHPNDKFNREVGRKRSLFLAMMLFAASTIF